MESCRNTVPINVVVGVIKNADNHVLIAKRKPGVHLSGLWEFPGGKVEQNETPLAALKRELHEEVGIAVISAAPLFELPHEYTDYAVILSVWQVTAYENEALGKEGQLIRWVDIADLSDYEFPIANNPIIQHLSCA